MIKYRVWSFRHAQFFAAVPPPFRPSEPALCGSCPLVTPYYCRLGDLLCFMYVYRYSCRLLSMHVCFVLFPLFDLSFVDFPSVLRYCWLGLLTCKNRLPNNLYCVGGDVKHCTIQSYTIYRKCYFGSLCVPSKINIGQNSRFSLLLLPVCPNTCCGCKGMSMIHQWWFN